MRIDVEDVFSIENERAIYNRMDLEEIEFYKDGKRVKISQEEIDEWVLTGLSNIDVIVNKEWPET